MVGCHRSKIGSELALNSATRHRSDRPKYRASMAQKRTDWGHRAGGSKLAASDRLRQVVQDQLDEEHSPEQISARLKVDFPHDAEMRVSHEAIYLALYVQGRAELRLHLHPRLRTGRALRKTAAASSSSCTSRSGRPDRRSSPRRSPRFPTATLATATPW